MALAIAVLSFPDTGSDEKSTCPWIVFVPLAEWITTVVLPSLEIFLVMKLTLPSSLYTVSVGRN